MFDVQYMGRQGWTLYNTQPNEGEALLGALDCARTFPGGDTSRQWRVVSPEGKALWIVTQTSAHAMVDKVRGE